MIHEIRSTKHMSVGSDLPFETKRGLDDVVGDCSTWKVRASFVHSGPSFFVRWRDIQASMFSKAIYFVEVVGGEMCQY